MERCLSTYLGAFERPNEDDGLLVMTGSPARVLKIVQGLKEFSGMVGAPHKGSARDLFKAHAQCRLAPLRERLRRNELFHG